jgi:hypothetical protein
VGESSEPGPGTPQPPHDGRTAGAFRISPLPAGSYQVSARKGALVGVRARPVTLAAASAADDVEIVPRSRAHPRRHGEVPSGKAIKGARLRLSPLQQNAGFQVSGVSEDGGRYPPRGPRRRHVHAERHRRRIRRKMENLELTKAITRDLVLDEAVVVTASC